MTLAISSLARLLPASLRLKLAKTIPIRVFLFPTLLILRRIYLGIPHLSPNRSASSASSWHK